MMNSYNYGGGGGVGMSLPVNPFSSGALQNSMIIGGPGASQRYHELQNIIRGVPIQCMVKLFHLNLCRSD